MGRRDTVWQNRTGGYIETTNPLGYDVLINGSNKYLNFNAVSGVNGYGFRDNSGTMEFKNSAGAWTPFVGSGGSATFTDVTISTFTLGSVVFAGVGGLLSQDNTNFFWDDTTNFLGLGTKTPGARLDIVYDQPAVEATVYLKSYSDTIGATYRGYRARGTLASPQAVQADDNLLTIGGVGWEGTTPGFTSQTRASVQFVASETWTSTATGTYIRFNTTFTGSFASAERMRLDPAGYLGLLTTSPSTKGRVSIQDGSSLAIWAGADVNALTLTNVTRKFMRFGMPHYTNAEEPVTMITGDSDGTFNTVNIGGGTSQMNAATVIRFITGATTTTTTGSEGARLDSSLNFGIGFGNNPTLITRKLDVGYSNVSDGSAQALFTHYGGNSFQILSRRAGGTMSAPTATASGNRLAVFGGAGYETVTAGGAFSATSNGSMQIFSTEAFTDIAKGTRMGFYTTANGATSETARVLIEQNGFVGIGTSSPTRLFDIGQNTLSISLNAWGGEGAVFRSNLVTVTDNSSIAGATVANAVLNSFGSIVIDATNALTQITNAATVYITAAPVASVNAPIISSWALWIDGGDMRIDEMISVGRATAPLGNIHIQQAAGTAGATPPSLIVQNATSSGSWTPNSLNGLLDFASSDTTGLGVDTTRARIASFVEDAAGSLTGMSIYTSTASALTERARFTSAGQFLVGTTTARVIGANTPQIQLEGLTLSTTGYSATFNGTTATQAGSFNMARSRGTALGSVTAVQSGDFLGGVSFYGADGTGMISGASLTAAIDGAVSTNVLPTRLEFYVNNASSGAALSAMRITSTGLIALQGGTSSFPALKRSSANLQVRLADDSAFSDLEVLDEVYGSGWNASLEVPTKNAVYDKIESLANIGTLKSSYSTVFETSARFTQNVTGGSVTFGTDGVLLDTTVTTTRFARLRGTGLTAASIKVFANSPRLTASANMVAFAGTGSAFIGMGTVTAAGTGHTFTNSHIGFKILIAAGVASLYATQADGSVENASAALTTLTATDHIDLYVVVNGTTSVDYYYSKNGAALSAATNLTARLPTASDNTWVQGSVANDSTANAIQLQLEAAKYER